MLTTGTLQDWTAGHMLYMAPQIAALPLHFCTAFDYEVELVTHRGNAIT